MIRIPIKCKVRINGIPYEQIKATKTNIKQGDLVVDTKDNCYGYIDMKSQNYVTIKFGCVAEVGVPISRIRKLIPTVTHNQTN
jgi:hypothetical protein